MIASFLGWTLDAFDFFVARLRRSPTVATEFGTHRSPTSRCAITVTLALRPVGAFIFGLMADRYGRRLPLMIDLVFYSIVEVLSGLAPNYATFLVLRALFGIGMGGEWGVGASLAMEKVPRATARPAVGPAAGGLRDRLSARRLLRTSSSSRTSAGAPMFFLGGAAGAARALHPHRR